MGTESGARVAGELFAAPRGEGKSSTPKHAHRYIRTKRAAADLAATGELIRGMPRGRFDNASTCGSKSLAS
jgi:hypothetical protein